MKTDILKILNKVIKTYIYNKKNLNKKKMVYHLKKSGYKNDDIEKAFNILNFDYSVSEKADKSSNLYNRVFTLSEKTYLPLQMQGLIQRLMKLNILTAEENESLIFRTINQSRRNPLDTGDLWEILEAIIEEESKFNRILEKIPEFKKYLTQKYKYIN